MTLVVGKINEIIIYLRTVFNRFSIIFKPLKWLVLLVGWFPTTKVVGLISSKCQLLIS